MGTAGNNATAGRNRGVFTTLAAAIAVANSKDIVFVQNGTYTNSTSLLNKNVQFQSGVIVNGGNQNVMNTGGFANIMGDGDFAITGYLAGLNTGGAKVIIQCNSASSAVTLVNVSGAVMPVSIKFNTFFKNTVSAALTCGASPTIVNGVNSNTSFLSGKSNAITVSAGSNYTFYNCRVLSSGLGGGAYYSESGTTGSTCTFINCEVWGGNALYGCIYSNTGAGGHIINAKNTIFRSAVASCIFGVPNVPIYINCLDNNCYVSGTIGGTASVVGAYPMNTDTKKKLKTFTYSTTTLTCASHGYTTADAVRCYATTTLPSPLVDNGTNYYARNLTASTLSIHPTAADATNNTNAISLSGGSGTYYIYGV